MIEIVLNGETIQVSAEQSILSHLERWNVHSEHIAVAVNNGFVPRGEWAHRFFQPGDTVDIVAPMAGG